MIVDQIHALIDFFTMGTPMVTFIRFNIMLYDYRITDYLEWCNNDVESHYPGFGKVVLQIAPFVTWPKLVPTNPLDTLIVMLDERFEEDAFINETDFEVF